MSETKMQVEDEGKMMDVSGLDEDDERKMIKIISTDGKSLDFDVKSLKLSTYIMTTLEDTSCTEISLNEISGADIPLDVLTHVKTYLDLHGKKVVI